MIYRTLSLGIVAFWLTMMGLLVWREVLPKLTAGEPPKPSASSQPGFFPPRRSQTGILDGKGRRVATAWNATQRFGDATIVKSTFLLDRVGLIPQAARIESSLRFEESGKLAELRIDVCGPMRIAVTGAAVGMDFSINVKAAGMARTIVLDARAASQLTQPQDPLAVLGELKVGSRWRVHSVDVLSSIIGQKIQPQLILVEVLAEERIRHHEGLVDCFKVRIGTDMLAWIDRQGEVLRQEGYLPLVGKAVWQSESYNESELERARQRVPVQ